MTLFWTLIAATVVAAIGNWWAVGRGRRSIELVAKPATLALLIAAAVVLPDPTPAAAHPWFLVALGFSLLGDVFLLERREPARFFLAGLGAFLVAHVLFVVGLLRFDLQWTGLLGGAVVVAVVAATLGRRIIAAAGRTDRALGVAVTAYMAAIGAMVVLASGTGNVLAQAGALLFLASDTALGWNRFVRPLHRAQLFVMVTYHLAQLGLVLSLV